MDWLRRHSREIVRGAILGLLAGIVVCILNWDPCPAPMNGDTEARVIERWGPPHQVISPRPAEGQPMKKLIYRCGLFGTSMALIYVDAEGKVADVLHGKP